MTKVEVLPPGWSAVPAASEAEDISHIPQYISSEPNEVLQSFFRQGFGDCRTNLMLVALEKAGIDLLSWSRTSLGDAAPFSPRLNGTMPHIQVNNRENGLFGLPKSITDNTVRTNI